MCFFILGALRLCDISGTSVKQISTDFFYLLMANDRLLAAIVSEFYAIEMDSEKQFSSIMRVDWS